MGEERVAAIGLREGSQRPFLRVSVPLWHPLVVGSLVAAKPRCAFSRVSVPLWLPFRLRRCRAVSAVLAYGSEPRCDTVLTDQSPRGGDPGGSTRRFARPNRFRAG